MAKTLRDWHPEAIKAAIRISGTTLSQLSVEHGYAREAVRISLRKPWPAVEAIVAARLGRPPHEIWPTRYDASGNSLRRPPGRPKSIPHSTKTHRQKDAAA